MKIKNNHFYAVIMAGGSGTRLYPRSREAKPKQFQKIIGNETLIVATFKRINQAVPAEHIFISTNQRYVPLVLEQLPSLPQENIITEPAKRNTAPAMALATALILKQDPEAIIMTSPSDHIVLKNEAFLNAINVGFDTIAKHPDYLLTVGIHPTTAHAGYGYIERAGLIEDKNNLSIYKVKRFVEKPDKQTAQGYLDEGTFYWNAAYFIWQGHHFLNELKKHLPAVYHGVTEIAQAKNRQKAMDDKYHSFPDVAIDTAIMEKTDKMLVIPADLGWSDIGSWDAVSDLLDSSKPAGNGVYSEGLHIGIDTKNSIILGDQKNLIATIGLENIIVIATKDAILISERGRSEEVKKIIGELKDKKLDDLL